MDWKQLALDTDPLEARYTGDPGNLAEAYGELQALLQRPAWHAHAACRGHLAEHFPARGESVNPAKAHCSNCLVWDSCADSQGWRYGGVDGGGIWAGTSGRERRKTRPAAA